MTHGPRPLTSTLLVLLSSSLLAEPATNAVPPWQEPTDEAVRAGRHVYERQCLVCHGRWGDGRGELAPQMYPRPRRLTSGIFKYRSTPSGFLPTLGDLQRTIRNGIAGTSMPAFSSLSRREILSVTAYLQTLSSRWRRPIHHSTPVPLPDPPPWMEDHDVRLPHEQNGARLFAQLCAPCHGSDASGTGAASLDLMDVWDQPSRPPDLRQPVYRSGPTPIDLYRTLTTGLDGTPMASFAETTSEEERWELVAWIRSLAASSRDPAMDFSGDRSPRPATDAVPEPPPPTTPDGTQRGHPSIPYKPTPTSSPTVPDPR